MPVSTKKWQQDNILNKAVEEIELAGQKIKLSLTISQNKSNIRKQEE